MSFVMGTTITEYTIDDRISVKIRRCPPLPGAPPVVPSKPEYWYLWIPLWMLLKDLHGFSSSELKVFKSQGFSCLMWNGKRWWPNTPKQFATPHEAFKEWEEINKTKGSSNAVSIT